MLRYRPVVHDGALPERGNTETEVLLQAGDVPSVKCFALSWGFRPDGVPSVVG